LGLAELLHVKDVVPVHMGEDDLVDVGARIADFGQLFVDGHSFRLVGTGMMIFVGPLGPGHAGIDEDELFPALYEKSENRKGHFAIADVRYVFVGRMMIVILLGKGWDVS